MNRRSILTLCAVIALLVLSSCRNEDFSIPPVQVEDRIVQTASLTDDPNVLLVTWDPVECETFQEIEVDLEADFVNLRIRVLVDVENCPAIELDEVLADMGEPLGDRKIWDRAFADTVALTE